MNKLVAEPPSATDIEVTIFGPGFGESIIIHAGNHNWVVFDSCIDSHSGRPAALAYFDEIGVDASRDVKLIIATHWHDDHVGGISELIRTCVAAKFACSMALTRKEFIEVVKVYTSKPLIRSSGVTEFQGVFQTLKERNQPPIYATANRPLFRVHRESDNQLAWEVTALSPADGELQRFLASVAALLPPSLATTKTRLPNPPQNDISVAAWVTIGEINILLGADLEEHNVPNRGWTAVIASTTRPRNKASVMKIAHHGSRTGHHDEVWGQMLVTDPIAVLTPWKLAASSLPQLSDVKRINRFTKNGYSTSRLNVPGLQALPPAVKRTLREAQITMRQIEPATGYVRLRTTSATTDRTAAAWTLTASDDAVRLSD